MANFSIQGNVVDILNQTIYTGEVTVVDGKMAAIKPIEVEGNPVLPYILPGFVDSHVHVESSMLVPSQFAKLAVVHGTVGTVSDPHEIANVCGMAGVEFMIENGNTVPFKFNFGAPSCVPATIFETAGAAMDSDDVKQLLERPEIKYLSEMMNFPGVLYKEEEVIKKIAAAHALGKPVDGHAPGLSGEQAIEYINAGISTDHECFTAEEALHKLKNGMKILIREGSAAKNFEALIELLNEWPEQMMFCSDDKHPDSLAVGHLNQICARAVAKGVDVFKVLRAACINPILHYKLDIGMLREGDDADFIVATDLVDFNIQKTYINGRLVAENGVSKIEVGETGTINQFDCEPKLAADFEIVYSGEDTIAVIEAMDGQLITNRLQVEPKTAYDTMISDTEQDVLKMVVINRYHAAPVAKAWVKNFGFKTGAIASSVAHDSHNIIAVGVDDESIANAVNLVIAERGGVSAVSANYQLVLALPVAGLMSDADGYEVAKQYTAIDLFSKGLGSKLSAPFMTLSFMALLVIPHLKLSDKGLFDGDTFSFV